MSHSLHLLTQYTPTLLLPMFLLSLCAFKVYDGDNVNVPLVGSFCGNTVPMPFVSSGNFLTVFFVTDGVVQKRGFNATYRGMDGKTPTQLWLKPIQWSHWLDSTHLQH